MSHVKTDKLSARTPSGTITLGESGETFALGSGATVDSGFTPDAISINASAPSDALAINASGNVGIGTSSPSARLHVSNNQGGAIGRILLDANVTSGYENRLDVTDNGLEFSVVSNSRDFIFNTGSPASTERMRIDASGNLKFDSGYGSTATAYGCRAWVNFNGTGTLSVRGSGNVSSVTDYSTGIYRMNFATSPPDSNYCAVATKRNNTTNNGFVCQIPSINTSYVEIQTYENSVATDSSIVSCAVFR